jgi:predicted transcriptional regulator
MKDTHLTLRIPTDLADTLTIMADELGVTRSRVVREALEAYTVERRDPTRALGVRADLLAARLTALPALSPAERSGFARDTRATREHLGPVRDPWE